MHVDGVPQTWAPYADFTQRVASGVLRVKVEATYPIEEIKAAHAERDGCRGKILVLPNGPVAQTLRCSIRWTCPLGCTSLIPIQPESRCQGRSRTR